MEKEEEEVVKSVSDAPFALCHMEPVVTWSVCGSLCRDPR